MAHRPGRYGGQGDRQHDRRLTEAGEGNGMRRETRRCLPTWPPVSVSVKRLPDVCPMPRAARLYGVATNRQKHPGRACQAMCEARVH